jgi:hypothetical protein
MIPLRSLAVLPLAALLTSCSTTTVDLGGPYDLTFRGSAAFGDPHGGDVVRIALLTEDLQLLEAQTGTVSSSEDPAFEFVFSEVLEGATSYRLRLWIDSNIDGGTAGECDPPEIDHQWGFEFTTSVGDVELTAGYDTSVMSDVCSSF